MNEGAKLSAVLVHQGAPGGIGQVERLMDGAFLALGWRLITLTRRHRIRPTLPRMASIAKARFALRVIRTVAKQQPNIVLLTHLNFAPLALPIRIASPRSRIVSMAHGTEAWSPLPVWTQLALKAIDAVWCNSASTRAMLIRESATPSKKLRVLLLGLPQERAKSIESQATDVPSGRSPKFRLLSVSRLDRTERWKGIEHVLLSLAYVRLIDPRFDYRVIGAGDDLSALQGLARSIGVSDMVEFTGTNYGDDAVANALHECDAVVLPAAREGFCIAHVEAMCAGKPLIAARSGATPQVVGDKSGVLTTYGDAAGIAQAILHLMSSSTFASALGRSARARYDALFTEAAFQARVRQLLEAL